MDSRVLFEEQLCYKLKTKKGLTRQEIADETGLSLRQVKRRLHSYYQKMSGDDQNQPEEVKDEDVEDFYEKERLKYKESVEILGNGEHRSDKLIKMSAEESKDIEFILKAHGYDIEKWELINVRNNIWNVYSKKDGIQTLFSSKISVKPRIDTYTVEDAKKFFEDLRKDYIPPVHTPTRYSKNGKLLELNIADLHLGKKCWAGDSGDTYDEKQAEEMFFYIINDVLTRTEHYDFEKIWFVFSNDFFHFDNDSKTTTGGTPQDTNLQFHEMYQLGNSMLIKAIDLLSTIAPVKSFYIGSNHDRLTSYFAIENLKSWFRNNKNVEIDSTPRIRKYEQWGDCLVGFSHGNTEKKRLGKLMPIEARELWGRTKYHEFHAGHFHSEQVVKEENGTIVRYLPTVSGTDKWHYESGYLGAIKKSQSFVWDKHRGLLDIINTSAFEIIEGDHDE